jgi:hypothetical protein
MILDTELMACGAQSETLSHIRISRFGHLRSKSMAASLISSDGIISTNTASFAGELDLPAFIAWLGSGLTPGAKQE